LEARLKKAEIDKLLAEVGGGKYIGDEYHSASTDAENCVTEEIAKECGSLLLFGDAVNQFYVDTLRVFFSQLTSSSTETTVFMFHWHIVSSTRCRAAFNLWKRGYYFEAATLSRTLWETAITVAGLKRQIVTIEELFGGRMQEGIKKDPKEIIAAVKKADNKVQEKLLWKNERLTSDARSNLQLFMQVMNQATHKSNLALFVNIKRQQLGKETIPLFSRFDMKSVTMTWNIFFLAMWSLTATLKYLDTLHPRKTAPWHARFEKMLLVCRAISEGTQPPGIVGTFGAVIDEIFTRDE
jgi:hypothetical protein